MPWNRLITLVAFVLLPPLPCTAFAQGGPLPQEAYVKASNTRELAFFGWAVAASGDTIVVGSPGETSAASGVDGNQSDGGLDSAGAAYVYVRNGTSWTQQAYLKASDPADFGQFGFCVAISGNTIVVGSPFHSGGRGAAYVFERSGSTWAQTARLDVDPADNRNLGSSVAVHGDTIVVGARNQRVNTLFAAGAAYVYVRQGGAWTQQAILTAAHPGVSDWFGRSVDVWGNLIVVGADGEDSAATGIDGDQTDDSSSGTGAAYLFVRQGTTWSQRAYLKPQAPAGGSSFGYSVGLWGETVAVGAMGEDFDKNNSGAVYVFEWDGSVWYQQGYLKAEVTKPLQRLGWSVDVWRHTIVAGAPQEAAPGAAFAGVGYVFVRDGSTWHQQASLYASNADLEDQLGYAAAVANGHVVFGAPFEGSGAVGIDGPQADDSTNRAGAAYVFETLCSSLTEALELPRAGTPPNPSALLPGVSSQPLVGAVWDPVIDHTSFLPSATIDFLMLSADAENMPTPFGTILCGAPFAILTRPAGTPFELAIPSRCSLVGDWFYAQGSSWDRSLPAGPGSFRLSNALDVRVGTY